MIVIKGLHRVTPSDMFEKDKKKKKKWRNASLTLEHDHFVLQRRTLRNGTTTACYFATIHTDASLLLCQITGKISPPLNMSA